MNLPSRLARAFALASLAVLAPACGAAGGDPPPRVPAGDDVRAAVTPVALPAGVTASAVWASPLGGGLIAGSDGRVFAVRPGAEAAAQPLDAVPGEAPVTQPVTAFAARRDGAVFALARGAPARLVEHELVRDAALPDALAPATGYAPFGAAAAIWALPEGLVTFGADGMYVGLELPDNGGPVRAADSVVTACSDAGDTAAQAWVLAGGVARRVRRTSAGAVEWSALAPDTDLGTAQAVAALECGRGAVVGTRGLALVGPDGARAFRADDRGAPLAAGGGGPWLWVAWPGELLRTDGTRWQRVLRAAGLRAGARLAVDPDTGASALLADAAGAVVYIEAEPALRVRGVAPDALVTADVIELEALPPRGASVARVAFALDGAEVAARTSAPWGWGPDGDAAREFTVSSGMLTGPHRVELTATLADGATLRRAVPFRFEPAGAASAAPSFARDIAPILSRHCARCHATGIARPITDLDQLRAVAPLARASVREQRMPPDVLMDPGSEATLLVWLDGALTP